MATIRKSFKREIGVAGLLFWLLTTGYLYLVADVGRIAALTSIYVAQCGFTWGYAAAAFGMHALATQFGDK